MSGDDYQRLYNEAIKFEPDYFDYYKSGLYYLLPQWYGEEGEREPFQPEALARQSGERPAHLATLG